MALQNFEKTDASYPFPQKLPLIVQYVSRILQSQPLPIQLSAPENTLNPRLPLTNSFRKGLCQILLSCMVFSPQLTMMSLASNPDHQQLGPLMPPNILLDQLFDHKQIYLSSYERKLFIFALTNLLFGPDATPIWSGNPAASSSLLNYLGQHSCMDSLSHILTQTICMLMRQQRIEQMQRKKAENLEEKLNLQNKKRAAQSDLQRMNQGGPGPNKPFKSAESKDEEPNEGASASDEEGNFAQIF